MAVASAYDGSGGSQGLVRVPQAATLCDGHICSAARICSTADMRFIFRRLFLFYLQRFLPGFPPLVT